ncbi:MAG: nadK [Burkholderiaceae bacterium]|nr:nadK [Burkholderiaceae bacterium]
MLYCNPQHGLWVVRTGEWKRLVVQLASAHTFIYNAGMNKPTPLTKQNPTDVRTVAIVGRTQSDSSLDALKRVIHAVVDLGKAVIIEEETHTHFQLSNYPRASIKDIGQAADVMISVGGDGTMLGNARQVAPYGLPIIGVNQGHLGFITDIALADVESALREILVDKHYAVETRDLFIAQVVREGEVVFEGLALNDVVVARRSVEGMLDLNVRVNEQFMYRQRADSLIIATTTGSTAYSLAAGGPILHPQLAGITLVPVAPQSLSNRPIVLPNTCTIEIGIAGKREAAVHCDSQVFSYARQGDQLRIALAPFSSIFWHPLSYNYFATLRQKLNWQLNPSRPL